MKTFDELLRQIINTTLLGGPGQGYTKHGDSDQHLMTLFSLVLQLRAKNILELGVRHGDTSLPLAMGCYLTGGTVDAIDLFQTEFTCPEILKPHYNFIQSDAIKFLEENTKTYDVIYIDDWHSYKHVKRELELIDKCITQSTIILLHDLMGNSQAPRYYHPTNQQEDDEWGQGGPYAAVKELDLNNWEWSTIPVNNGLTILRKK